MKKSIKKSSRRKWVVGGVAFFGSIALLTTGFATWVVGVQQTDDKDNVNVTVDTTINEFVTFSLSLLDTDNSIKLGETKQPDDAPEGKVNIVKIDEVTGDLTVKIDSLNIEIGNDALDSYTQIDFAITSNNNDVSSQQFPAESIRTGAAWSYLSAPASILLTNENITKADGTNTTTYTLKPSSTLTLNFGWGDFFGEQSPANFYNSKYHEDKLGEDLSDVIDKINTEMDDMSDAFDEETGKNVLTLQATLTNGRAGA